MILNFSKIQILKKDDPVANHFLQKKSHEGKFKSYRNGKGTRDGNL